MPNKTKIVIIFGGYAYLYQPPFYSNLRYFEIKVLVIRTSNFRESTEVPYPFTTKVVC